MPAVSASAATAAVEATVPWQFSQSGAYSQWLWTTKDFHAVIVSNADAWSWEVKSAGATPVGAGSGIDFDTCADLVLEAVGKGFGPRSGYARWTKGAAHKYTLANGVRTDLSDGGGKEVRVTLVSGRIVEGVLYLGDWLLHLVDEGLQSDIHPSSVARLERLL
jgi:hypothetical protein